MNLSANLKLIYTFLRQAKNVSISICERQTAYIEIHTRLNRRETVEDKTMSTFLHEAIMLVDNI